MSGYYYTCVNCGQTRTMFECTTCKQLSMQKKQLKLQRDLLRQQQQSTNMYAEPAYTQTNYENNDSDTFATIIGLVVVLMIIAAIFYALMFCIALVIVICKFLLSIWPITGIVLAIIFASMWSRWNR